MNHRHRVQETSRRTHSLRDRHVPREEYTSSFFCCLMRYCVPPGGLKSGHGGI